MGGGKIKEKKGEIEREERRENIEGIYRREGEGSNIDIASSGHRKHIQIQQSQISTGVHEKYEGKDKRGSKGSSSLRIHQLNRTFY